MIKIRVLFLLLLLIAINGNAQNTDVISKIFEGTIGKYPIVLKFEYSKKNHEYYDGAYYYKSQKLCIAFNEINEINNTLTAEVDNWVVGNEQFVLKKQTDNTYLGTWTAKGKVLKVVLKPLNLNSIKHTLAGLPIVEQWKKEGSLMYPITSTVAFKKDTVVKYSSSLSTYWYTDNIVGLHFFRLAPDNKLSNAFLTAEHLAQIETKVMGCNSDGDESSFEEFEMYLYKDSILSYSINKGMCICVGAAHPGLNLDCKTFNINTGKVIGFDEMFSFAKNSPNKDKNWDLWMKYRTEKVAPVLVALLRKNNKDLKATPPNYEREDDGQCFYLENDLWWSIENWTLCKDGLMVWVLDGATGYGPCGNTFVFPYRDMNPYMLKKGSIK